MVSAMASSDECVSPTLCRPHHLDPERLRVVLNAHEFTGMRYHEAVVVASKGRSKAFQLLVLASECVYLLPLASFSSSELTCIPLKSLLAVERVSPQQTKQRGMLLVPSSQLFHLLVQPDAKSKDADVKEIFVSTFEPDSHVLFHLSCAFHVQFQKQILAPESLAIPEAARPGPSELAQLLESLIEELLSCEGPDLAQQRSELLQELATALTSNLPLQRLLFENQTQIYHHSQGQSRTRICSHGLPAFLLSELTSLAQMPTASESTLRYALGLLDVLQRACFDGHLLAARTQFFESLDLVAIVDSLTRAWRVTGSLTSDRKSSLKTPQWKALAGQVLSAQAALLLELETLQLEANALDRSYLHRVKPVAQMVLQSERFQRWLSKFARQISLSVLQVVSELNSTDQGDSNAHGSMASLTLWRNVTMLDLLLYATPNAATTQVLPLLMEKRIDELKYVLCLTNAAATLVLMLLFCQQHVHPQSTSLGSANCQLPTAPHRCETQAPESDGAARCSLKREKLLFVRTYISYQSLRQNILAARINLLSNSN